MELSPLLRLPTELCLHIYRDFLRHYEQPVRTSNQDAQEHATTRSSQPSASRRKSRISLPCQPQRGHRLHWLVVFTGGWPKIYEISAPGGSRLSALSTIFKAAFSCNSLGSNPQRERTGPQTYVWKWSRTHELPAWLCPSNEHPSSANSEALNKPYDAWTRYWA